MKPIASPICSARSIRAAVLVAFAAWAGGCANSPNREAAYESWLAPWQGASEESLIARWGKPTAEESAGASKHLSYVVIRSDRPTGSTLGISIGGFGIGGGGHTAVGGGVGVTAPLNAAPATCTTTFLVEGGKVVSWVFEGAGCEAPPR